ncbi:restriction endonuclease subunit S [Acetobacterium woodii]|uniref:Type I restriction-modification system specificity subunit HsdS3 n=1 Tax=Acetobacterium woodii (strain ATCC 29683 / DSM 1030 / JCM 2381 / KCTC 1655 / WB1) TaxID=931626 RepID=H6LHW3_ACEWD|nr:restriction endonuclease subunit S [Acetobacterium woodii]AFA48493.1 type I restriction-modification system specificity subunit HsdS3 [Acetobacterium woodii DSM 1030]
MSEKKKKVPQLRFPGFSGEWEERKLGDLLSETRRPIKMEDDIEYQLVTVKRRNEGVTSRGLFKGKDILVKNYFELKHGDYVISKRQVVHGANGIVPEYLDGAIVSNEYLVSVGNKKITTDFLTIISKLPSMYKMFFLSSYGIDIEKLVFNVEDWKKRKIFIPPVPEQKIVSTFFLILDNAIALQQRKLTHLQARKKGLLQKMFPKDGELFPELRFPGFTDAWEERRLGEVVQITMGQSPNSENYTHNPDDHILVQGNADMRNGQVFPRVWTTQVTKKAEKGDLILSVRAPVGDIGKTYYDVVLGRGVAALKGNEFIYQSLGKMKQNGYWNKLSTGSTFEAINSNDIRDALLMMPNIEEQAKIGAFFKQLDDSITLHQRKLDHLQTRKKALLQQMFV